MTKDKLIEYICLSNGIELLSDPIEENPIKADSSLKVGSLDVPVKLKVWTDFPDTLPAFYLPHYDSLGFIPHVLPNGNICYLETESSFIDKEKPLSIFQDSVELTIKVLADGYFGNNHEDFREEFNLYWYKNKNTIDHTVLCNFKVTDRLKVLKVFEN